MRIRKCHRDMFDSISCYDIEAANKYLEVIQAFSDETKEPLMWGFKLKMEEVLLQYSRSVDHWFCYREVIKYFPDQSHRKIQMNFSAVGRFLEKKNILMCRVISPKVFQVRALQEKYPS